jgi:predicted nucleic acid-binding protein
MERRGLEPAQVAEIVGAELAAIASMTASELLAGVHRANTPSRRRLRQAFVEAVFERLPVFPFDLPSARTHAELLAQLTVAGRPVGAHDLIIAATALAHGAALLTDNIRDFQRIPDLVVRQPVW